MSNPIIVIIGSGGHAKVVCDALQVAGTPPAFFTDASEDRWSQRILGVEVKGNDDLILEYDPTDILLVNGIASVKDTRLRKKIYLSWVEKGYSFANVIHPNSIVAGDVKMGQGVQVLAGAILQPTCELRNNVIVNTKASVDHDCVVGDHCHVAPGSTISGFATLESGVHVGTAATIVQSITIGQDSTVAAGAVVVKDVLGNSIVKGIPGIATPKQD